MNESTRKMWDNRADTYFTDTDHAKSLAIIKSDPARAFPRDVWEMLRNAVHDLKGKRVLVPSSGDNLSVFGFHLLGAKVTSTDLSEKQLGNAAKIAAAHHWDIEFRQADSMALDVLPDSEYDLIHTSNGAHVWIGDLGMMYRSFYRVLKPGGSYVFFETHPFCRPFDQRGKDAKIIKPYTSTGPFNDPPEFAWRIEDFIRALMNAGFTLADYRDMQSYKEEIMAFAWHYKTYTEREKDNYAQHDWKINPWAALPTWMGVSAIKK